MYHADFCNSVFNLKCTLSLLTNFNGLNERSKGVWNDIYILHLYITCSEKV